MILIDIEGPVFSQISFAHVVRSLAFAFEDLGCSVSIQATDRNSSGYKNVSIERNYDRLISMTKREPGNQIKILYNFPVNMANCRKYNFAIVSWETTTPPLEWINELNKHADQVWSISSFVNEAFIQSGVDKNKTKILPMGVDSSIFSPNAKPIEFQTTKKFKFLHLGVAQQRKGTPILLSAYSKAFTKNDDVALIIKSNGFGVIDEWIKNIQPEIVYIYKEAPEEEMAGYYTGTDCFVYPVHAEGAGLPVLESLACGRPAIVPLWSGLTDFCNPSNSFPLRYKIARPDRPYSTYSGAGIETWAEVSESDLIAQMQYAATHRDIVARKGSYAASYISKKFNWHQTALTALGHINEIVKSDEISNILKRQNKIIEPKIRREIAVEVPLKKIGVFSCHEKYTEAYFYAKTSLDHSLTKTVGFVSKQVHESRFVPCIEPGMASPSAIDNVCKTHGIDTIQIHWDRWMISKEVLPGLLRQLKKYKIILFIHDELPADLPSDFFNLADSFFTNSIKIRNSLLNKGGSLKKIRYLPPLKFFNRLDINKNRAKLGIGEANFVFISIPKLEILNKPAHVIHLSPDFVNEYDFIQKMSMADAFILQNSSNCILMKNPLLCPLMSFEVPIISSQDVLFEEMEEVFPLNFHDIYSIADKKRQTKNKLSSIEEYVKLTESMYYDTNFKKPEQEHIIVKEPETDYSVFMSEL